MTGASVVAEGAAVTDGAVVAEGAVVTTAPVVSDGAVVTGAVVVGAVVSAGSLEPPQATRATASIRSRAAIIMRKDILFILFPLFKALE